MPGTTFVAAAGDGESLSDRWQRRAAGWRQALPLAQISERSVSDGSFFSLTYAGFEYEHRCTDRWEVYAEGSRDGRRFADPDLLAPLEQGEWDDRALRRYWDRTFVQTETLFLLAYDKLRRRLWFANDGLSRLPAYVAAQSDRFGIGRDYATILLALRQPTLDKIALAFTCLFQYPVNDGLPHAGVRRLMPATLGYCDFRTATLKVSSDDKHLVPAFRNGGSFKQRIDTMVELFLEAAKRQGRSHSDIVASLSAGLDSRTACAALARAGVAFRSATFSLADGTNDADVTGAADIARTLASPHDVVTIAEPAMSDYEDLFALKTGLNYLEMGTLLAFLRAVAAPDGSRLMVTGSWGNPVMSNVLCTPHVRTLDDALDYTFFREAVFAPESVEAWLRLPSGTMRECLRELFAGYPWPPQHVYRAFACRERLRSCILEADDRDRCYVPTDTPFLDRRIYDEGISMPERWKAGDRFYRAFCKRLSPELARVVNPSNRVSPASPLYAIVLAVKPYAVRLRRKLLGFRLQGKMLPLSDNSLVVRRIRELASADATTDIAPGLPAVVADPAFARRPRAQQLTIYTILALINAHA